MTKNDLKGYVLLFKGDKSLLATRKIRIFQRENIADRLKILIPFVYEELDLEPFIVTLQYLDQGGTVYSENLVRLSDGQGGYEDYEDADGNKTHMIYTLDITSKLTYQSGDITVKITMDYVDQEAQTSSNNDDEEAPDPTPVHHVINSDSAILTVLPIADYYSVVPDASLSLINNKIADLDAKQKALEETANTYMASKADNLVMHIDQYGQSLYLTSNGHKVGDEIDLNDLGVALSDWTSSGLVKVITDEDEPEPGPTPSEEYANDIVLVINQNTKAIYLLSNGHRIGNPIYLDTLGDALADYTPNGLIKVITDNDDDDNGTTVITDD
ncbi:MAG: hypothetical protein IJ880_06050 [Bacilli bacterium]|nr:hypothetical protein [Bacilli bacterium]